MKTKQEPYIFQLGELFERVQLEKIFPDSKTFVDCIPKEATSHILEQYDKQKNDPDFDLEQFVHTYFEQPPSHTGFTTKKNTSITEHIDNLWDVLTRETGRTKNSLISLPKPYVVPGGRFREMFYWDSYFTMLGLKISDRKDLIEDMIENFAFLINTYGYIPNGNRTYFLSRSQPPFFALMVDLMEEHSDDSYAVKFLPEMETEYAFWMKGASLLSADTTAVHRVMKAGDDGVLNRYWDEQDTPRPEAYRKDIEWSRDVQNKKSFFRHERAACESGWDFSSRWFMDGKNIATNRCADLAAVDLNCLLFFLEQKIAETHADKEKSTAFYRAAADRKALVDRYFWNDEKGFYFDYDLTRKEQSEEWTIAAAAPLFLKLASPMQADAVAQNLEKKFLKSGGFLTTLTQTGQQWDAPNGWAPLEWIAIRGLMNYGHTALAKEAAKRWMHSNETIFDKTGKLMEKYNVEAKADDAIAGTYPTQDGFGWTNGVYLACREILHDEHTI